jgi:hypothetical protein
MNTMIRIHHKDSNVDYLLLYSSPLCSPQMVFRALRPLGVSIWGVSMMVKPSC